MSHYRMLKPLMVRCKYYEIQSLSIQELIENLKPIIFSAPIQKGRMNISSPQSFSLKHSLRSLHDGILIGVNTLSIDAPRLDVRVPLKPTSGSTPRPIVLDSHLKILSVSNMLLHSPIVFTLLDAKSPAFVQAQQSINGTIVTCKQDAEGRSVFFLFVFISDVVVDDDDDDVINCRCCLKDCLYQLYHQFSICSLLVEGGANIIQSFLDTNLVDQVVVFVKPSFAGGYRSLVSELSSLQNVAELQVGESGGDLVLQGRIA